MSNLKRLHPNRIYQGNCIEVLETIQESSVDLIFADPPYYLQLEKDLWRPNSTKVDTVNDAWDKFRDFKEYDEFTKLWLNQCKRVLKGTGTIWVIGTYHNIYRVGAIMQDLGYWILNDIVWIKSNPMPNFKGVRFTNAHETLIWAQKKKGEKYTFNHHSMKALNDDLQMRSDWLLPLTSRKERIKSNGTKAHSTQKPEALLFRVILSSSNPGDIILDPFFGSGTTGAIAKRLGRKWIGIESEEKYIKIAQDRIDAIKTITDESIISEKRKNPRIPFGSLIENGILGVGEEIFFNNDSDVIAIVLANGHIRYKEFEGSIHKVGGIIMNGPCNGWEHWYYKGKNSNLVVIDELRKIIREKSYPYLESNNDISA